MAGAAADTYSNLGYLWGSNTFPIPARVSRCLKKAIRVAETTSDVSANG
jgi:hypothetical protein